MSYYPQPNSHIKDKVKLVSDLAAKIFFPLKAEILKLASINPLMVQLA